MMLQAQQRKCAIFKFSANQLFRRVAAALPGMESAEPKKAGLYMSELLVYKKILRSYEISGEMLDLINEIWDYRIFLKPGMSN